MYEAQDEPRALAIVAPRVQLDTKQLMVLKQTIAPDLTGPELAFFGNVCQRMQLDPFARQIYAIKRGSSSDAKLTIQIGIDGFRALAERTGLYRGQIGPLWCGPDGEWRDAWLLDTAPVAAKVGVIRADFREPVWAVARTKAYQQDKSPLWSKMPETMIAKCAEALALRKAFPDSLSGAYEPGEMDQAGYVAVVDEAEYAAARVAETEPEPQPIPAQTRPAPTPTAQPARKPAPPTATVTPANAPAIKEPFEALKERAAGVGVRGNDWTALAQQRGGTSDPTRITAPGLKNLERHISGLEGAKAQAAAKLTRPADAPAPSADELAAGQADYDASQGDVTGDDFPESDASDLPPGAKDLRDLPVPAHIRP